MNLLGLVKTLNNMRINVKVKPNTSKNEIMRISDHIFTAKVTVSPKKGKANDEVIKLLSKYFKTAKSNISIIAGKTSREKIFEIQ